MQGKTKFSLNEFVKQCDKPMSEGDTWYIVDKAWFDSFKKYHESGDESEHPGQINNSALLDEAFESSNLNTRPLKENLVENEDFVLVPIDCWESLKETYGLENTSHIIERKVIESGPKNQVVELYPIRLKICLYGAKDGTSEQLFSRKTKLKDLEDYLKNKFNIKQQTKLWINSTVYSSKPTKANENGSSNLKPPPTPPLQTNGPNQQLLGYNISSVANTSPMLQTLEDVGATMGSVVTLEAMNNDGTWPGSRPRYGSMATRSTKSQPGLCGLSNMGNTCFMNAALQCLSNTPPLTNYILKDLFVDDLNVNNPLGMRGEIARTYAELIKVMWSGNCNSVMPREFKCAVSTFAPQFTGFAQQDCQELMAFLLDGLHEDLNRIRNKPYIEIKSEIDKRPDPVVAEESWSNYKKRNDSIVVDTFHALLKSTLVCPGCNLVSVTFDPFCYLSLPLPVKREKHHNNSASSGNSIETLTALASDPTRKPSLQLEDCISQFTSIERLGADDPWYCPKCKKHQQATKKFDIWSLPKILIIHLKRFSFSRSWRDKLDTLVEFPLENLDMSEHVLCPKQKDLGNLTYDLIGVANHFGGLGGGHYTAYAKNAPLEMWHTFDDAMVSSMTPSAVVTKSAYVLFYQLKET